MAKTTTDQQEVKFLEYSQPQLESGTYNLVTRQTVEGPPKILDRTSYVNTRKFSVAGERFTLTPEDIISVFPPDSSLGEFANVLPHVVLKRETLPWERTTGDEHGRSWLGILVFNESDSTTVPKLKKVELIDLLDQQDTTKDGDHGKLPDDVFFPAFPDSEDKKHKVLEYGEVWSDGCNVIDIKRDEFIQYLPTLDDLQWLTHVREVKLDDKSESYLLRIRSFHDELDDPAQVATVIGNRFGVSGKQTTVHLVSLESYGQYLPKADGTSTVPDKKYIRMVSLRSWTYNSLSQKQTFCGLLTNVNTSAESKGLYTLNVPYNGSAGTDAEKAVANALKQGMAAFNHRTRMGDKTVSWYHGPFVPYHPDYSIRAEAPVNTSDALTRYNPDSGMFDVSYSGAWQLGRMMALQNQHFAIALYNWKRGLSQTAIKTFENEFLNISWKDIAHMVSESLDGYVKSTIIEERPQRAKREPLTQMKRTAHLQTSMLNAERLRDVFEAKGLDDIPAIISNWLARLKLLYGVPFNYIVPDYRMLPNESLRFFYLDDEWFNNLLEGAMSLGRSTSSDEAVHQAIQPHIGRHTAFEKQSIRKRLFGRTHSLKETTDNVATGFLLKSQAVSGWPGLEVRGYNAADERLELLRMDHLGPDVLLVIFDGTVKRTEIRQEPEALHFGVNFGTDGTDPQQYDKTLRYIVEHDGNAPGVEIDASKAPFIPIKNYYRDPGIEVLKTDDLAKKIKDELGTSVDYKGGFTSAEFALEMIEGIQVVTYTF